MRQKDADYKGDQCHPSGAAGCEELDDIRVYVIQDMLAEYQPVTSTAALAAVFFCSSLTPKQRRFFS